MAETSNVERSDRMRQSQQSERRSSISTAASAEDEEFGFFWQDPLDGLEGAKPASNASLGLEVQPPLCDLLVRARVLLWDAAFPLWFLLDRSLNVVQCLFTCPIYFFVAYTKACVMCCARTVFCCCCGQNAGEDRRRVSTWVAFQENYGSYGTSTIREIVDPATGKSMFERFDITDGADKEKGRKMVKNMELIVKLRNLPVRVLRANLEDANAVKIARLETILLYALGFLDLLSDGLFLLELNSREGRARRILLPIAGLFTVLSLVLYLKDVADKFRKTRMLVVKQLLKTHKIDLPAISYITNDINTKLSLLVEDIPQICLLAAFVYFTDEPLGTLGKVSYWLSSASVVLKSDVQSVSKPGNVYIMLKYALGAPLLLVLPFWWMAARCCGGPLGDHFDRVTTVLRLHVIPFAFFSFLSALWLLLSFVLYFSLLA